MSDHFIEITDLTYAHAIRGSQPVPALRGLSLQIDEGEHIAIIGANGSGKTTLVRHLNALLLPTSGLVQVAGLDTRDPANHPQIRSLVGMVFQAPEDQIVATLVEEDVAFGPENLGLPAAEIHRRVDEALETVQMSAQRKRPPHLLSAGQMQRVALAGILAMQPRCIIFDETTAMLDPAGRRMVVEIIRRLHREGLTIIEITHFMQEAAHADRIIVLNKGQVAMQGTPQEIYSHRSDLHSLGLDVPAPVHLADRLRKTMPGLPHNLLTTSQLLAALPDCGCPTAPPAREPEVSPSGLAWIQAQGLGHTYLHGTPLSQRSLQNANILVHQGEVHGIMGATGSGKSTLLQHLNGLLLPQEGRVQVGPFDLADPKTDLKAVRRLAGLAFQNPEFQLFETYVGDEIAYAQRLVGNKDGLRKAVQEAMEIVGLDFEHYKDRLTFTLSGGERRKAALASILVMKPEILLLDEPTAGLDPLSRYELLHNLQDLANQGKTLVFSSHRMEDLANLTQQITVMHKGITVMDGPVGSVFSQEDQLNQFGLEPPLVSRVANRLREKGWPVPVGVIHSDELASQLEAIQGGSLE